MPAEPTTPMLSATAALPTTPQERDRDTAGHAGGSDDPRRADQPRRPHGACRPHDSRCVGRRGRGARRLTYRAIPRPPSPQAIEDSTELVSWVIRAAG